MLEMRGIEKSFGTVRANRGIDISVPAGRIVGLLGENGSGKTTLMNVLFGMVRADAGTITFEGRPLANHSPRDAIAAGIGMIHQHFMLVPAMTVTDNVMLGWDQAGRWLKPDAVAARIKEISATYGLDLDPHAVVETLALGTQQRVEIVKALLRGARLLVLDEPTSNLSPLEVERLLAVLRQLRAEGRSVVFISHKLQEVLDLCDEVIVLRDGAVAGACPVAGATRESLATMMVGRDLPPPLARVDIPPGPEVLIVNDLHAQDDAGLERLRGVSLSVRAGEVFALAGVDGNGQAELADVIGGLRPALRGAVSINGADVTHAPVRQRLAAGLAHIPADRGTTGLIGAMTIAENLALREADLPPFRRGPWLDLAATRALAEERIATYGVRADGADALIATLSGGNQQKVIVAREIGRRPALLLAVQPTRGLDPAATRFVIDQVLALRAAGVAVLYISTELEEVMVVADRIGVIFDGRLVGVMRRAWADLTKLGLMMAGVA